MTDGFAAAFVALLLVGCASAPPAQPSPSASPAPSSGQTVRTPPDSVRGYLSVTNPPLTGAIHLTTAAGKRMLVFGLPRIVLRQVVGPEVALFGTRQEATPSEEAAFTAVDYRVRTFHGKAVHDGILHRTAAGDTLATREGRRLAVGRVPDRFGLTEGMHVWIAEPLDAPTEVGIIDPGAPAHVP